MPCPSTSEPLSRASSPRSSRSCTKRWPPTATAPNKADAVVERSSPRSRRKATRARDTRCSLTPTPGPSRPWAASPGAGSTTTCAPPWTRFSAANSASSTPGSAPCAATTCSIPTSATFGALGVMASSPQHVASYPLPVRQASALPSGVLQTRSRPRTPCLRLSLPCAGRAQDFHLRVAAQQAAGTVKRGP